MPVQNQIRRVPCGRLPHVKGLHHIQPTAYSSHYTNPPTHGTWRRGVQSCCQCLVSCLMPYAPMSIMPSTSLCTKGNKGGCFSPPTLPTGHHQVLSRFVWIPTPFKTSALAAGKCIFHSQFSFQLTLLQHVNFKIINITVELLRKSTFMKKRKIAISP